MTKEQQIHRLQEEIKKLEIKKYSVPVRLLPEYRQTHKAVYEMLP